MPSGSLVIIFCIDLVSAKDRRGRLKRGLSLFSLQKGGDPSELVGDESKICDDERELCITE